MLTRLEVDGFKNLLGFVAEFGPFTCIAGANAVGKSNLFDAIEFLSLLAEHSPDEAAQLLRGGSEDTDARDLFWRSPGQRGGTMRLAAEMIVPGDESAFLRYQVCLKYRAPRGNELVGQIVVTSEARWRIRTSDHSTHLRFTNEPGNLVKPAGVESVFIDDPVGEPLGETSGEHERTSLSFAPNSESELAIRRELQSWRRLALEPAAMRSPDRFKSPQKLGIDGSHLAATLYRIAHQDGADAADIYAELASRLSELTPIHDVRIDRDDKRELLTLEAELRQVGWVDARGLSEGTLRFLALASLSLDPDAPRLVCIEEPENGIHPAVVGPLADLLRSAARAPERQIIVNTHSPIFVRHVHEHAAEDLLMAKLVGMPGVGGGSTRALRLKPLVDTWRCHDDVQGVGLAALIDYLESPRPED
ncbi:AAA family ATPase [Nannocystaceae bacterium ST9]